MIWEDDELDPNSEEGAMASAKTIQEINRELAERINAEALANPQSPYAGKFVGIANGQVVIVTDDLDELESALESASASPEETYFLEAGYDDRQADEIWCAE